MRNFRGLISTIGPLASGWQATGSSASSNRACASAKTEMRKSRLSTGSSRYFPLQVLISDIQKQTDGLSNQHGT